MVTATHAKVNSTDLYIDQETYKSTNENYLYHFVFFRNGLLDRSNYLYRYQYESTTNTPDKEISAYVHAYTGQVA